MSLQGYSRFALNLVNYTFPTDGWLPTRGSTEPLFNWLELAMFTPIFRIPESVLNWSGFGSVVERFKPFRELIMNHYRRAANESLQGEPIYRPIWWVDYKDYREGKYSADEASVWANDRQFMIGNDLLIAAFLQVGGMEQKVYLPPGIWRDPESQQGTMPGGGFVYVATPENVACFERVRDKPQPKGEIEGSS